MTIATVDHLTADQARRLTERIRLTAHTFAESRAKLIELVDEAKDGNAHIALGYASWTAYLSDVLGDEPLRLARDDRRELVGILSSEGMSTRAIAPIVGVHHDTVAEDLKPTVGNPTVERPAKVTSLDGRERPATQPRPPEPVEPRDPFANWSQAERDLLKRLRSGETIVVNMRGDAHAALWSWAEQAGLGVRIDRKGIWGNPFLLPDDGTRDEVCDHFADHYFPHKPSLHAKLASLNGKALGCWCAPARCHGDFLAEQASR